MLSTFPLIHNMPTWTTHAHTHPTFSSHFLPHTCPNISLFLFLFFSFVLLRLSFLSLSYTHYCKNLVSASYSPMSFPSFFFLSFLFFAHSILALQPGWIDISQALSLKLENEAPRDWKGERVDSERKMVYKKEGEGERYWRKGKRNRRMEKIDCIKRKKRKEEGQKEWWLPWNDCESEACVLIMGCFMAQLFLTLHLN